MQINNVINSLNNTSIKSKKNPHFGALKIDSKIFKSFPEYADDVNLECIKKAAEELKNTKFYDLHIGCIHNNVSDSDDVKVVMHILDKKGKNISDTIDEQIYLPACVETTRGFAEDWASCIKDNRITLTLHHIGSFIHKTFEVANNSEANKLMDSLFNARVEGQLNRNKLCDELKNLDSHVKFIKILEAVEQYNKTKYDNSVRSFNKALDYFQKNNLSDCIINTRSSLHIDKNKVM